MTGCNRLKFLGSNGITLPAQLSGLPHFGKFSSFNVSFYVFAILKISICCYAVGTQDCNPAVPNLSYALKGPNTETGTMGPRKWSGLSDLRLSMEVKWEEAFL